MPISRSRSTVLACSAVTLAAAIGVASLATAQAAPQPSPTARAAAAATDAMPSAIEDFRHPGAERILKERNITLKQGDGHIRLKEGPGNSVPTDCHGADEIFIKSRLDIRGYCFTVTGTSGYLTMELPDAYAIWTEDHPVTAKLAAAGQEKQVSVAPNSFVGVGDGISGEKRAVLVELRVTG